MKLALTSMFFICFSSVTLSQDIEEEIKQIRKWYGEVENNLPECQKLDLEDYTLLEDIDGPQEISAYYHTTSDRFIKVEIRMFGDWYEEISQYYLNDEKLFFQFTTVNNAEEMYTAEELKLTEQELWERGGEAKTIAYGQYRTYYKDDQIIRYLSKFKIVNSGDPKPDFAKIVNETELVKNADGAPDLDAILTQFKKQLN